MPSISGATFSAGRGKFPGTAITPPDVARTSQLQSGSCRQPPTPPPQQLFEMGAGGNVTSGGHGGPGQEGVLRPRPPRGSAAAPARPLPALGALQRTACFPSEPLVIPADGGETEAPGSQRGGLKSQTGSQGPGHRGLSVRPWLHQLANPMLPGDPAHSVGAPV